MAVFFRLAYEQSCSRRAPIYASAYPFDCTHTGFMRILRCTMTQNHVLIIRYLRISKRERGEPDDWKDMTFETPIINS